MPSTFPSPFLGGGRTAQVRIEMYNAFNVVVYNARQTQLQLVSPTNQTIRNPQFLADGSVDPNRAEDDGCGVWRGHRRATTPDDSGAVARVVLSRECAECIQYVIRVSFHRTGRRGQRSQRDIAAGHILSGRRESCH